MLSQTGFDYNWQEIEELEQKDKHVQDFLGQMFEKAQVVASYKDIKAGIPKAYADKYLKEDQSPTFTYADQESSVDSKIMVSLLRLDGDPQQLQRALNGEEGMMQDPATIGEIFYEVLLQRTSGSIELLK